MRGRTSEKQQQDQKLSLSASLLSESLFFAYAKKSNQKKAHPAYAPRPLRGRGSLGRRDFSTGHPCPVEKLGHPCPSPCGFYGLLRRPPLRGPPPKPLRKGTRKAITAKATTKTSFRALNWFKYPAPNSRFCSRIHIPSWFYCWPAPWRSRRCRGDRVLRPVPGFHRCRKCLRSNCFQS